MSLGDIRSTTVNINGQTVFSAKYRSGFGYLCLPPPPPISCFGFGFGGFGPCCCGGFSPFGSFNAGAGAMLGMAAGAALAPAVPAIFKGIGKVITSGAKGIWKGAKWVGNTVAKGAKKLWNWATGLFHKKDKNTKKA